MTSGPLRCPFSVTGVLPDAMSACPGFATDPVIQVSLSSPRDSAAPVVSCAHLAALRVATGRYAPVCHHPEAERITVAARALVRAARAGDASAHR
jgi:hypothetical protein